VTSAFEEAERKAKRLGSEDRRRGSELTCLFAPKLKAGIELTSSAGFSMRFPPFRDESPWLWASGWCLKSGKANELMEGRGG